MAEWGLRSRPMETRSGSVRIVLAGLLLAACKTVDMTGLPGAGQGGGAPEVAASGGAPLGPLQFTDVARITFSPSETELEFAIRDGQSWSRTVEFAVDSAPASVTLVSTGEPLVTSFARGRVFIAAPESSPGPRHRVLFGFEGPSGDAAADAPAFFRVAPTYKPDRGNVEIEPSSRSVVGEGRLGSTAPAGYAFENVVLADFPLEAGWAKPTGSPEGAAVAAAAGKDVDPVGSLLRFCERELLTRMPMGAREHPGGPAAAWFGGLVAARPGKSGHGVTALGTVLESIYFESMPDSGQGYQRMSDDAWAVPRYMALRETIGAQVFRDALREVVDRYRGADPITANEIADVFQDVAGDEAGAYARTWLAGPAKPVVRTQWRFDSERSRLLLRINQVHEAGGSVPAAFPIRIPLRVNFADGSMEDHAVLVTARRELLEVPCDGDPLAVTFDPDDLLVGLCSLEVDE